MLCVCVYTYFYILILSKVIFYDSQEYCVIVKKHTSSNAEFLAK